MRITIRLLSTYREFLPIDHDHRAGFIRDVPAGTRVQDILADLHLPTSEPYTILVNGCHAVRQQALNEGDIMAIFPAAGGG